MPMLLRWCRRKSATFLAVLAAGLALTTGAGVTLANAVTDSAQNAAGTSVSNATSTSSGIAPAMTCAGVGSLDLAAAASGVPFQITSAKEVAAADNTLGKWARTATCRA